MGFHFLGVRSAKGKNAHMKKEDILRASEYWDKNIQIHTEPPAVITDWLNSPLVDKYCLNKLKVGNKTMSVLEWLPWLKEKYVPEILEYGLS
jgi:hypothetical protein